MRVFVVALNVAFSGNVLVVNVKFVLSMSTAPTVVERVANSSIDLSPIVASTGASFTGVYVIETVAVDVRFPSEIV